jgi:hypothetical protein
MLQAVKMQAGRQALAVAHTLGTPPKLHDTM